MRAGNAACVPAATNYEVQSDAKSKPRSARQHADRRLSYIHHTRYGAGEAITEAVYRSLTEKRGPA